MRRLPPVKIPPKVQDDSPIASRPVLHIAIIVPTVQAYHALKSRVRVVRPPYWEGKVHIHVLVENPKQPLNEGDLMVLQAAYELGWGAHGDLIVTAPDNVELGFTE